MKNILLTLSLFIFLSTNAQNNAFTFNGIDQQIATYTGQTNIRFTTQNFTIEAWVKPAAFVNSTNNFEHTILGNDNWDASNNYGYVLRTGGNRKLDFTFGQGNTWYSVTSPNAVFNAGEWTHVAVVRNGTTFTLFANGVQVAQQTFTQNIALATANLRIAENGNGSVRFFNGSLDEIKFWNTARTVTEVRDDLAATTTPLPPELIVYYKMDQTTGQAVVSETAVNLFAQYLPTAQVNSGTGFFRTYTFETTGNWTDSTKWKNGFTPTNLDSGDFINVTANCNLNVFFNLPVNITMNIFQGFILTYPDSRMLFIYGNLNINGTLQFNGSSIMLLYGIFNISSSGTVIGSNAYFDLQNGSICNNYGKIGDFVSDIDGIDVNAGASLNCFAGAAIRSYQLVNNGLVNLQNGSYFRTRTLINGNVNNVAILNTSGVININNFLNNYGTINNYYQMKLYKSSIVYEHQNYPSGIINNIGGQSDFYISSDTGNNFKNEGVFNYQNIVLCEKSFENTSSGIVNAQLIAGLTPQFNNAISGLLTNNGTFNSAGTINNSGSMVPNQGSWQGYGNFVDTLFTNNTAGIIAPSNNTGTGISTLTFANGLTNNGIINIDLAGTNTSEIDKINVTGIATLGGTLNVSLINSFVPQFGTTDFVIMNYTSRTGSFATVNYPNIAGISWSIIYNSTNVVLRAESTLSNQEFETIGLKTYPNPIKNILNIISPLEMESLKIFNLLGQEVLSKEVNGTETNLDISNLANGTYILKTIVNGVAKTVKIVKA